MTDRKRCGAVKKDGQLCQRLAMLGREHCFTHDPELSEERRRACQKGARMTNAQRGHKLSIDIPEDISTVRGLMGVINYCVRELLAERLDPKIAAAIDALVKTQVDLIMDCASEERLDRIEAAVERIGEATKV